MPVVKSDLRSLVTAEGATILDYEADELTTLNATGGYIWAQIRDGVTIGAIVDDLVQRTGQDPLVISNDVDEFLNHLASRHLLTL